MSSYLIASCAKHEGATSSSDPIFCQVHDHYLVLRLIKEANGLTAMALPTT